MENEKVVLHKGSKCVKRDENSRGLKYFLYGEFIEQFVTFRYFTYFMIVFAMFMFYIWNRYEAQTKITQIAVLKKEIRELRYRSVTHNSEVLGQGRQSQIKQRLSELGLEFEESKQPPYLLKR